MAASSSAGAAVLSCILIGPSSYDSPHVSNVTAVLVAAAIAFVFAAAHSTADNSSLTAISTRVQAVEVGHVPAAAHISAFQLSLHGWSVYHYDDVADRGMDPLVLSVSRRISLLSFCHIVVLLFVYCQSFAIVATFISISRVVLSL